jgi:hypothetical protein
MLVNPLSGGVGPNAASEAAGIFADYALEAAIIALEGGQFDVQVQQALDAGKLDAGQPITVDALVAAGVCAKVRDGVKLLGQGDFSAKVSFEVARASKTALAAIQKAGGSIKLLVVDAPAEA